MNKVLLERAKLYRSRAEAAKTPDARLRWAQMAEYLERLMAESSPCPPHDFSVAIDGEVKCAHCGTIERDWNAHAEVEAEALHETTDGSADED